MNWRSNQTIKDDSRGLRKAPFTKPVILGFVLFLLALPLLSLGLGDLECGGRAPSVEAIIAAPAVQSKLAAGEKILWSSTVDVDRKVREAMIAGYCGIAFTFVGAFSIAAASMGVGQRVSWFKILFFVPFLLAGLFLNTAPYWMHKRALETVCILTDSRALEFESGGMFCNMKYSAHKMAPPKYEQYAPNRGNVLFYWVHKTRHEQGFHGITNGQAALSILKDKIPVVDQNK